MRFDSEMDDLEGSLEGITELRLQREWQTDIPTNDEVSN